MSLQLACALSGQLRSFVNAAGPLLDSPSPDDKKMARSFWIPHPCDFAAWKILHEAQLRRATYTYAWVTRPTRT